MNWLALAIIQNSMLRVIHTHYSTSPPFLLKTTFRDPAHVHVMENHRQSFYF